MTRHRPVNPIHWNCYRGVPKKRSTRHRKACWRATWSTSSPCAAITIAAPRKQTMSFRAIDADIVAKCLVPIRHCKFICVRTLANDHSNVMCAALASPQRAIWKCTINDIPSPTIRWKWQQKNFKCRPAIWSAVVTRRRACPTRITSSRIQCRWRHTHPTFPPTFSISSWWSTRPMCKRIAV